jgi:hypothetical protein
MKKKINYWIIYFFLTVGTAFLFDGGIFAGHTAVSTLSKGGLGTIKLSGTTPTSYARGRSSIIRHQARKQ